MEENKKSYLMVGISVILLLAVIVLGVLLYRSHNKAPEVVNVPSTTESGLRPYFPNATKSDIKDISHQITRAYEKEAPIYRYYTITQEAADKQAQEYAKKDHADKVVKTTVEKEVKDDQGNTAGKVIENQYYAVNLNRKHDIKVGAADIDGEAYGSVSYRNRDVEYTGYKTVDSNKYGAGISVTVAKW